MVILFLSLVLVRFFYFLTPLPATNQNYIVAAN